MPDECLRWRHSSCERGRTPSAAGRRPALSQEFGLLAQLGERLPCKQDVAGSNPAESTSFGREADEAPVWPGAVSGLRRVGLEAAIPERVTPNHRESRPLTLRQPDRHIRTCGGIGTASSGSRIRTEPIKVVNVLTGSLCSRLGVVIRFRKTGLRRNSTPGGPRRDCGPDRSISEKRGKG